MADQASNPGVPGQMKSTSAGSEFNQQAFHHQQEDGRKAIIKLVKITKVKGGDGAIGKAGAIDMQPLTKQMDGEGNTQSHGTVYNLIYFRIQGGKNAIIMDPKAGDMGYAAICDRDISANKKGGGEAQPGSHRRFSMSDGIYMGGVMNEQPVSFLRWETDGSISLNPMNPDNLSPSMKMFVEDKKMYLGGTPPEIPKIKFSPVLTSAGPSINVLARFVP